jgi:hypothetical protein
MLLRLAALIIFTSLAGQAFADNWNVIRLRGTVLQLVEGAWQPLERGGVVPDDRVVLTRSNGYATLTRGNETIELSPNTQIQIYDQGGAKPFTTVVEHFGTVAIEAEVRNVQHFAVKNQYLAAVVKGTRFVVTATRTGGTVQVQRGHVEVDSSVDESTTLITVGQKADVKKGREMKVSGQGKLPPVIQKGGKAKDRAAKAAATVAKALADLKKAEAAGDVEAIEAAQEALEDAADVATDVAHGALDEDKAAAKAAADAAKAAEKAARDAAKAAEKAAKDQAKAEQDAAKAAEKAARDAEKAAEKAAKDQAKADHDADKAAEKAAEDARKAAEKAAEEARKAAEKAAKDAEKAAKDAEKAAKDAEKHASHDDDDDDHSGKSKGGGGDDHSGKGKSGGDDKSKKGKG